MGCGEENGSIRVVGPGASDRIVVNSVVGDSTVVGKGKLGNVNR